MLCPLWDPGENLHLLCGPGGPFRSMHLVYRPLWALAFRETKAHTHHLRVCLHPPALIWSGLLGLWPPWAPGPTLVLCTCVHVLGFLPEDLCLALLQGQASVEITASLSLMCPSWGAGLTQFHRHCGGTLPPWYSSFPHGRLT